MSTSEPILTSDQEAAFHRDGMLVVRGFYNLATDIEAIQRGVYDILGLVIAKHRLAIDRPAFHPDTFDAGYQATIADDRRYGAEIYDAVKQIPAFVRLAVSPKHDRVFAQLRPGSEPGFAAGGSGIRIDNPNEDKFRANWHQDYPTQLRSPDGLVFWSTLVPITPDLGPVEIAVGSHRDGPVPVYTRDPRNPEKAGAYALTLQDEEARLARYPHTAPLASPGDLILLDYLVLHASGANRGTRSRWSMQMRYFNYRHPVGVQIGWRGLFTGDRELRALHPELVLN